MGTVSSIVVIFTKTSIELGSVSIIKIKVQVSVILINNVLLFIYIFVP